MDKAIIFELIAGGWATATLILVIGFLNAVRQEVGRISREVNTRLDKIDTNVSKLEDRVYDLAANKMFDATHKK